MKRYVLKFEIWEDGKLLRAMEESRDKLENDYSDGELTAGFLLSFVPSWIAAGAVGGCGLATISSMAWYMPTDPDTQVYKTIGEAYEKWGASHEFCECVSVVVNHEKLECNEDECDHACT